MVAVMIALPPKYFTAPGFPKGQSLFNLDWASKSEVVVVCEGTFDAISVGRSGVAALGKGVTEYQARMLVNTPGWKLIILLLDPGDADKEMSKLVQTLGTVIPVLQVQLKGYKDAGETPRNEIWLQAGEAAFNVGIDLIQYKILL